MPSKFLEKSKEKKPLGRKFEDNI